MTKKHLLRRAGIYFFITALTFFSSCRKDPEKKNCAASVTTISGTYKIVSLKYRASPTAPEEDYMIFFDDCEKDDHVRLNTNKTYDYIDAGVSCNPQGSDQGIWDIIGNKISSDGLIQGEIQSFDCKTLIVFKKDVYSAGDVLTFTFQKL